MKFIATADKRLLLGILLLLTCLSDGLLSTAVQAQPLLKQSDLIYQGAFRLPSGRWGNASVYDGFSYGGSALAYNPANDSLFIVGHDHKQMVAEISIPQIVNSSQLSQLSTARVLQPFRDATDGKMYNVDQGTIKIGGLLVYQGKLYITAYSYYDGDGNQVVSHFSRPLNLSTTGQVAGPFQVGDVGAGFVSGYMTHIPQAWQSALGGPTITGNCCISIVSRTSSGPAAFSFDPAQLGVINPVPHSPLVYYPYNRATLGAWNQTGSYFNGTTQIRGLVFPEGTSSLLFFGRQGIGPLCYGTGEQCGDPKHGSQGTHAYPYVNQIWAYDVNNLSAVKNSRINPWDVPRPELWRFTLPFGGIVGGVTYDPGTQRIFLAEPGVDSTLPVIHVWKVGGAIPLPPPQNTAPIVNGGLDQVITFPASASLNGFVTDGGLHNGTLTVSWSKVSGPGTVTFANSNSAKTIATFSAPGSYVLKLSASDGPASASDDVSILINPEPAPLTANIDIEADKNISVIRCQTDTCTELIRVRRSTNLIINGVKK